MKASMLVAGAAAIGLGVLAFAGGVRAVGVDAPVVERVAGESKPGDVLPEGFGVLRDMVGYAWEIDGKWLDGRPIWARNEMRPGLNDRFVVADVHANENGKTYHRYHTIYALGEDGVVTSYGFTYDGSTAVVPMVEGESEDGDPLVKSTWLANKEMGVWIKQELEFEGESYAWRVWSRMGESGEWTPMMDGRWHRKEKLGAK